ncbi:hypothetical protein P7H12_21530 [Paenibacillus larvae]|nr:hypothetical protein [Paenibacillus larvae]MDT2265643.1 hypothetical protein [Paenibacillus larvae]
MNLIDDDDKLRKAAKKFAKDYTLVGDVVLIQKTSDGKSYSLTSADIDEERFWWKHKSLSEQMK